LGILKILPRKTMDKVRRIFGFYHNYFVVFYQLFFFLKPLLVQNINLDGKKFFLQEEFWHIPLKSIYGGY